MGKLFDITIFVYIITIYLPLPVISLDFSDISYPFGLLTILHYPKLDVSK